MRLIDADDLKKSIIKRLGISDEKFLLAAEKTLYEEIENAPTVEAIPIEWIKEVICLAEKTGFTDYAYKLNVLLSDWAERKEE